MLQEYRQLHNEMLIEINGMIRSHLPEEERISLCFWIAADHWEALKKKAEPLIFQLEKDEIDFFRNVKPGFTAYINYFTILSEALLFVPEGNGEQFLYWKKEAKRYERFRGKHNGFVNYYESGKHNLDKKYFTKAPEDWQPAELMAAYDSDKRFCSTHDYLVRGLLAHKMYNVYARNKWVTLNS